MKPQNHHFQVAIITDASEGLGAELACLMAAKWQKRLALVLAGKNERQLQLLAAACKQFGCACLVVRCATSSEYDCRRLIRESIETFGDIDILIHNCGRPAYAMFADTDNLTGHQELMRRNFWSGVWCSHAALPHLEKTQGKIVSISSLAALLGASGQTADSASKFASRGFFDSLRSEVSGIGISVLTVYSKRSGHELDLGDWQATADRAGASCELIKNDARRIMAAMESGQSELVLSRRGKLRRWLSLIAPRLAEKMHLSLS